MTPRLLIFDLDGTLIDSRADLVASVNAMLRAMNREPLEEAVVAAQVGHGAAALVRRALALADERAGSKPEATGEQEEARGLEVFLAHYGEHKLDRTVLYPGVAEGLRRLAGAGHPMAVLTNKPVRPSREIVEHLGVGGYFFQVLGGNSFERKKPDPVGILALLEATGLGPERAVMIGDSDVDVLCGRNAGCATLGVSYGFLPATLALAPPDRMAHSFEQAAGYLLDPDWANSGTLGSEVTHGI